MKFVGKRRLALTTPAEKKLCFAFQVLKWALYDAAPFQREKTVHISDFISRSLDFYFSCSKVGVEADGDSHYGEAQKAKDEWTDRLIEEHAKIKILRFRNAEIMNQTHSVVHRVAIELLIRHDWPPRIRIDFLGIIAASETAVGWQAVCDKFWDHRRGKRTQTAEGSRVALET